MSGRDKNLPLCIYIISEGPNGPCKIGVTRSLTELARLLAENVVT